MDKRIIVDSSFTEETRVAFINGSEIKIDGGWLAAKTRAGEINIE